MHHGVADDVASPESAGLCAEGSFRNLDAAHGEDFDPFGRRVALVEDRATGVCRFRYRVASPGGVSVGPWRLLVDAPCDLRRLA